MKESRAIQVLKYAKKKGIFSATPELLWRMEIQRLEELRPKFDEITQRVLQSHGWTLERWRDEVLEVSGSFYFCPTGEQDILNKEIKATLLQEIGECPPVPSGSHDYLRTQLWPRKGVGREKKKGRWFYFLI